MMYRTLFLAVLSLLVFKQAHADNVTAINITADYYPGNQYAVGLDLDNTHLIDQVYFQDQNGNKTFFTLDQLANYQPIFEIAGIPVVQMKIDSHVGNTQAIIDLQYITNKLTNSTQTLQFSVVYNATEGAYDVTDLRTGKIIHNAEATTQYGFLHIPVGIASIQTH